MKFSVYLLSFTVFATGTLAQELPPAKELAARIALPGYWEVENFKVIAQAMVGTPMAPRAQIRFEVDASPRADLYVRSGTENLGPFVAVIASTPDDSKRTLYGTMDLTYSAGQWGGPVVIENPVDALGQPKDFFTEPTLVLGTPDEKKVLVALQSNAASEITIILEQQKRQLIEKYSQEFENLKASQALELSALREAHQAALSEIEELTSGEDRQLADLKARLEERYKEGEAELKNRLATVDAELTPQIEVLTAAHQEKLRELKATQAAELGQAVVSHVEELQKLQAEHAKAVGALVADQEREMAEITTKLETRKSSLEAQLATADEVLALQASLTSRQTAIRVNDESIKAAEQARQQLFGQSLDGFIGNWVGSVMCKSDGKSVLYTVSMEAQNVRGRLVDFVITNQTNEGRYGNSSKGSLHLQGNDLTLPLVLRATLENDLTLLGAKNLDLTLQTDGWMVGASPDGVCTDIRLSKS